MKKEDIMKALTPIKEQIDPTTAEDTEQHHGLDTGYKVLDSQMGGLESGVTVVGASSGTGKTAFCLGIAAHAASHGKKVLYFSLEMTQKQIINYRLIPLFSGVSASKFRARNPLDMTETAAVIDAKQALQKLEIIIVDSVSKFSDIKDITIAAKEQGLADLVVIDHIGLVAGFKGSAYESATRTIDAIADLARTVDLPLIAVSQLSRGVSFENRQPRLHDLRDSGMVEADATAVLLLHKPQSPGTYDYTPDGRLIGSVTIAKNRYGVSDYAIPMVWDEDSVSWQEQRLFDKNYSQTLKDAVSIYCKQTPENLADEDLPFD